jgi:putative transposase
MGKQTTTEAPRSSVTWGDLEEWVRLKVQEFIQSVLEEEVTDLLGRPKSERRGVDSIPAYRNGYGRARRLTSGCGTIVLHRPRIRGLEERFESKVLPFFVKRTREVNELIPELYLHGLAQGDFNLALRGLLGEKAPLSAGTVARLKEKWQTELIQWRKRSLADLELVYMWVDGIYVKAGLEKNKAALLVAIGGLSDGSKVILTIEPGYRESAASWVETLKDMKERGLSCPRLVTGDGNLGIWGALSEIYPEALTQRCWNHKIVNVLDKLPKKAQEYAKSELQDIAYAPTCRDAEDKRDRFAAWCREKDFQRAAEALERDWERMVTFYRFPKEHWIHLRTTNIVESPFAALRLRTGAAKRFKKVENATAIIWKMMLVVEKRFRKLNAPEKLNQVFLGVVFRDGVETKQEKELVTA